MPNIMYSALGGAHGCALAAKNKVKRDLDALRSGELSGQGLIEYVLIIAVISLVVVLAGPQIAKAIHDQFDKIASVLNNGTNNAGDGGGILG